MRLAGRFGQHGLMPDVLWEDIKEWFDPQENGSAPDVCVADSSVADWEAFLDLVRVEGWRVMYSAGADYTDRLPDRVEDVFVRTDDARARLVVWPDPGIEAVFRPVTVEEIRGDLDLYQLQGQERLDALCRFLRTVGRRLGKPVTMTAEGDPGYPLIGYQVESGTVEMLAGPWAG